MIYLEYFSSKPKGPSLENGWTITYDAYDLYDCLSWEGVLCYNPNIGGNASPLQVSSGVQSREFYKFTWLRKH